MIIFPEKPENFSGYICIPETLCISETLDYDGKEDKPTDEEFIDYFVEVLIESMKRSLKRGSDG